MAGQSIVDRVTAVKHIITGHGLAKAVCKSTTEELMGPKKKHIDYLLLCTNEPNVSIPQLADLLIERTTIPNWVVVFKALVSVHNLMNYGNERFTQYLASNNCTFHLESFLDKTGVHGYDMSTFIRRYAKYLNGKAVSYRAMAFDFCKVKRGKDGLLRNMSAEKLIKSLPVLQAQVDGLLEFDCSASDLTNGVINACFMLLFKDLIRLFACYNDGIINLLENYFEMNKKSCRESINLYKRFLVRMDKVSEFLADAERVGIDKGDIPDLAKAPSSLLEALEAHLASLEANKRGGNTTMAKPPSVTSAINTMAAASATPALSDDEKKKILEEEQKELNDMKEKRDVEIALSPQSSTNPFSAGLPSSGAADVVDLFGASAAPAATSPQNVATSNVPISSTNPFASAMAPTTNTQPATDLFGATSPVSAATDATAWPPSQATNAAAPPQAFAGFGEVLQPQSSAVPNNSQPVAAPQGNNAAGIGKDLDSSLASLYGNLNMNTAGKPTDQKDMWNAGTQQPTKMTGGTNGQTWAQPQPGVTQPPMGQPMMNRFPALPVQQQAYYGQQTAWQGNTMGAYPSYPTYPMATGFHQPMGGQPMGGMPGQQGNPAMFGAPANNQSAFGQPRPTQPVNDPFGNL